MVAVKTKLDLTTGLLLACVLPGLGHIYIREYRKALLIFLGFFLFALIPYIGLFVAIGTYGWSISDILKYKQAGSTLNKKMIFGFFLVIALFFIMLAVFLNHFMVKMVEEKKKLQTLEKMNSIIELMTKYREEKGIYAERIEDLVGGSPIRKSLLRDAWGRGLILHREGKLYRLHSTGKDGVFNTEDDLYKTWRPPE